jgi:hypothetical protein
MISYHIQLPKKKKNLFIVVVELFLPNNHIKPLSNHDFPHFPNSRPQVLASTLAMADRSSSTEALPLVMTSAENRVTFVTTVKKHDKR